MTVASILAEKGREVAVAAPSETLMGAANRLAEKKIGALVVVEEGTRIVGIISERDIVRAIAEQGADALETPVRETMTREVVTCADEETINDVMARMSQRRFRHLPVVNTEGRLDGIISIGDVVKRRIMQIELEAEELRSYISST